MLPGGFGNGQGAGIAMGCAWDDPDSPIHVETDPEECFVAVLLPGPHLTGHCRHRVGCRLQLGESGRVEPDDAGSRGRTILPAARPGVS